MKRVKITSSFYGEGFHEVPEMEIASWLEAHIANNTFGKPDRWLPDFLEGVETRTVYTQIGIPEHIEIIGGVETTIPEIEAEYYLEYLHPAEYTYEIIDITEEYEAEQAFQATLALGKKAKEVCDEAMNYIRGYNITAGFTTEQINQLKTDFALVREYLMDGQPYGTKAVLLTIDNPDFTILKTKVLEILSKVTG
jgi:hypothetical protein